MSIANHRIVLARRPVGLPTAADFRLEQAPLRSLREGEMLVANQILSMDPAIRGFLDDRPSYLPPVAIGETVRGMTLGRVLESRKPGFVPGTIVRALAGWEELSIIGEAIGLEAVDVSPRVPLQVYMGALGASGLTAWIGLNEIGRINSGETVLISAAAGAVGSVAGQIARLQGCRVIGLAGSPAKIALLEQLGFDGAIDYRASEDLGAAISAQAPQGIDVYFDNVGGATLEAVLPHMALHGRVIVSGMISEYNDQDHPYGVRTLWQIVVKRLSLRGFLTYEHAERLPEAAAALEAWVHGGQIKPLDNVREGLANAPAAFIDLMSGRTSGKTLVRLGA